MLSGSSLKTLYSGEDRAYTGEELRPHYLLTRLGLGGDALAAFQGSCSVKTAHLVDWEDRLANDRIDAKRMVHFLGEFFGISLSEGVLLQRLLMATMAEKLAPRLSLDHTLTRDGDDLYVAPVSARSDRRKLSVSIVTASPVSVLLHAGINIDPEGAPVAAIGLKELKTDPESWAREVLEAFATEWTSMKWACAKVRPVM